ncbi:MAG: hypothetical protein GY854_16530 [Deltaproteobacteria bacterium]|nr:hypothetical protein [Deltaproteobacteria bacterium]
MRLHHSGAVTYPLGQVIAFDAANGNWKVTDSTVATVANAKAVLVAETVFTGSESGGIKLVRAVIGGKVDADQLVFEGTDTLDTVPSGAADSFRTQLRSYGIIAEELAQQRIEDNQ